MLPQVGGLEWLVIGMLALIVIGPKDLPGLLRTLGQWTAKLRGMANEFRTSFDEMARQSELDDLRKEVEQMRLSQSMREMQASLDASVAPYEPEPEPEVASVESPPAIAPEPPAPVAPKPARKRASKASADGAAKTTAAKAPAKPRKPKASA